MFRKEFENIKTNSWHTIEYLGIPASNLSFEYVERDLEEPEQALHIRNEDWSSRLSQVQEELEQANPDLSYVIEKDTETGRDALFQIIGEEKKRKMFDGRPITLAQADYDFDDNSIILKVYPIDYSEWVACSNPHYAKAFRSENLAVPYAGLGISVLIESKDGLTPLTRRGIETPVYPGRLYSPGGGPKEGQDSTESLLEEIVEETGLKAGEHFDINNLKIVAFVSDTHFDGLQHSRPEIIATLPIDLTYRGIEDIQQADIITKGKKETDVWGLEPISMNLISLRQRLKLHGREMCPPTEAGLTYMIYEQILSKDGPEKAMAELKRFTKDITKYTRRPYKVPINLLSE